MNPFDFFTKELLNMNKVLIEKLEEIVKRLDVLIEQGIDHGDES